MLFKQHHTPDGGTYLQRIDEGTTMSTEQGIADAHMANQRAKSGRAYMGEGEAAEAKGDFAEASYRFHEAANFLMRALALAVRSPDSSSLDLGELVTDAYVAMHQAQVTYSRYRDEQADALRVGTG